MDKQLDIDIKRELKIINSLIKALNHSSSINEITLKAMGTTYDLYIKRYINLFSYLREKRGFSDEDFILNYYFHLYFDESNIFTDKKNKLRGPLSICFKSNDQRDKIILYLKKDGKHWSEDINDSKRLSYKGINQIDSINNYYKCNNGTFNQFLNFFQLLGLSRMESKHMIENSNNKKYWILYSPEQNLTWEEILLNRIKNLIISKKRDKDIKDRKNHNYFIGFALSLVILISYNELIKKYKLCDDIAVENIETSFIDFLYEKLNKEEIFLYKKSHHENQDNLIKHFRKDYDTQTFIKNNIYSPLFKTNLINQLNLYSRELESREQNYIQNSLKEIIQREHKNKRSPQAYWSYSLKLSDKRIISRGRNLNDLIVPFQSDDIIEAAHIVEVKQLSKFNTSKKIEDIWNQVWDENNGLLLDRNIHKLFDKDLIVFDSKGRGYIKNSYAKDDSIRMLLKTYDGHLKLNDKILNEKTKFFLKQRLNTKHINLKTDYTLCE